MERKKGLEFARAVSAIGVIAFHFYYHSASNYKLFYTYANGYWGIAINFLFFALSGYLMCLRYGWDAPLDLRSFCYKRWKATIPAYLLVFSYMFMQNVFLYGRFFYLDIPKSRLLLTLVGLDGYVQWLMPTYFMAGEWFLGAILVAYACYPLLRFLQRKAKWLTLLVLMCACVCSCAAGSGGLLPYMDPTAFVLTFYIGMLMAAYPEKTGSRMAAAVAAVLVAVLVFGKCIYEGTGHAALVRTLLEAITGISLLIGLNYLGERICACPGVYRAVRSVADLSYYTFLIHHPIIYMVLGGFNPKSTKASVLVFGLVVLLTLFFSKVLQVVMKSIFDSSACRKLEGCLTKGFRKEP